MTPESPPAWWILCPEWHIFPFGLFLIFAPSPFRRHVDSGLDGDSRLVPSPSYPEITKRLGKSSYHTLSWFGRQRTCTRGRQTLASCQRAGMLPIKSADLRVVHLACSIDDMVKGPCHSIYIDAPWRPRGYILIAGRHKTFRGRINLIPQKTTQLKPWRPYKIGHVLFLTTQTRISP